MEDLIYIILGLLWLVFTFYSQSKKRKEKQMKTGNQQTGEREPQKSILEDLFGEMEMEPEETPYSQQQRRPYRKVFEDQYEDMGIESIEKTGKTYHKEASNPIKETSILKQEIDLTKDNIRSLDSEIRKGNANIDIRKALIYQAIMDTPYI